MFAPYISLNKDLWLYRPSWNEGTPPDISQARWVDSKPERYYNEFDKPMPHDLRLAGIYRFSHKVQSFAVYVPLAESNKKDFRLNDVHYVQLTTQGLIEDASAAVAKLIDIINL